MWDWTKVTNVSIILYNYKRIELVATHIVKLSV